MGADLVLAAGSVEEAANQLNAARLAEFSNHLQVAEDGHLLGLSELHAEYFRQMVTEGVPSMKEAPRQREEASGGTKRSYSKRLGRTPRMGLPCWSTRQARRQSSVPLTSSPGAHHGASPGTIKSIETLQHYRQEVGTDCAMLQLTTAAGRAVAAGSGVCGFALGAGSSPGWVPGNLGPRAARRLSFPYHLRRCFQEVGGTALFEAVHVLPLCSCTAWLGRVAFSGRRPHLVKLTMPCNAGEKKGA